MKSQTITTIVIIILVIIAIFIIFKVAGDSQPPEINCIAQVYWIEEVNEINTENCIIIVNINKTETYEWENKTITQTWDLSRPLPYQDDGKCLMQQIGDAYCDETTCIITKDGICELRKYCPNGYEVYSGNVEEGDKIIDISGWRCV